MRLSLSRAVLRMACLVVAAGAASTFVGDEASAHGGIVRGPRSTPGTGRPGRGNPGRPGRPRPGSETPPPGQETPPPGETPPPEPEPPPPSTTPPPAEAPPSAPKAPTTPRAPGPTSGPVAGAPTPPPAGGPAAGRTGGGGSAVRRKSDGVERWQTWWSLTRELYLGRHHSHGLPQTPAASIATGRGAMPQHDALLPDDVRKSLLPLLAQSLRDDSVEVADSAAIALGRSIPTREAAPILPHLIRNLAHPESSPQEAALLGLGLCGGAEAVAVLRGVALDRPEGRAACNASGPLDDTLRGLALLALGLAGTQDALSPIVTVATSATASRELAATAVLAMGLQQESAPAAIVTLSRMLDERGLDKIVRSQVPIAMARLPRAAARGMLPKLLEALADRRTPDEVARSAALAVGKLASIEDDEAVRTMMEVARRHSDAETREFALVALGRIGESGGGGGREATRTSLHAFLIDQLRHPERKSHQPWAALALGLVGRSDFEGPTATARLELSGRKLVETFEESKDPALQGALALALGLGRHGGSAPLLRARLVDSANPELRGQLALALGMLKDRESIEPMRALVTDPALPPTTRIDVARGLALLGDGGFEGQLVDLLANAGDSNSAIAYAKALGLVGGTEAATALRALAEDRNRPEIQRGFAVVALGLLAEKSALPWNVPYLVDANFTVPLRSFDAIAELL